MNHSRRKYGVAIIAVLGFVFSAPVAFAGMELGCVPGIVPGYNGQCVNLHYFFANYLDANILLYDRDNEIYIGTMGHATGNSTQHMTFPQNVPGYVYGYDHRVVAVPAGVGVPSFADASSGLYDYMNVGVMDYPPNAPNFLFDTNWGTYAYYYTPPPVPFSAVALRVFTPTTSREFLAGVGSSTTATGASLLPIVAVAISIPLFFSIAFWIYILFDTRESKHTVKPQKVGYTVKL